MPFVTGLERIMKERGRQEGFKQGFEEGFKEGLLEVIRETLLENLEIFLDVKFGEAGREFFEELKTIADVAKLKEVQRAIRDASNPDVLRKLLANTTESPSKQRDGTDDTSSTG